MQSMGSRAHRLQEFYLPGPRVVAHGLSCPAACGIRDRTHVPCSGRQILNHWMAEKSRCANFLLGTFCLQCDDVKTIRLIFYILMETQLMTCFAFLLLLQKWNI